MFVCKEKKTVLLPEARETPHVIKEKKKSAEVKLELKIEMYENVSNMKAEPIRH